MAHEGVTQNQDMVFFNKLAFLSDQGKHEASQFMMPFVTKK